MENSEENLHADTEAYLTAASTVSGAVRYRSCCDLEEGTGVYSTLC